MSVAPKYSAWHKELKVMAEVKSIIEMNYACIGSIPLWVEHNCLDLDYDHPNMWPFDKIELRQWSGLIDRAGVDIFVGDIVRVLDCTDTIKPVKFIDGAFVLLYPSATMLGYNEEINLSRLSPRRLEVIGNIYQHPELLERKDE